MSKTNHRVHKDREEKLGESYAHKKRRGFKRQASEVIEIYSYEQDLDVLDEFEDEEFESIEKIRKRR